MKWVGYSENSKQIVATRALAKMESDVHNFHHMGGPLFRSKEERNQFTQITKSNWGNYNFIYPNNNGLVPSQAPEIQVEGNRHYWNKFQGTRNARPFNNPITDKK